MKKEKNVSFQILSGIAILLVVFGHLDFQILTIGGLFPYYSFHVMTFVFISGYFYKEENEKNLIAYVIKKAKHLLVPYFIWNLFYGILIMILHQYGYTFGGSLSFHNLVIEPFVSGHQFMLNFASWFVPALFLIQVINVLGRKCLSLILSFLKLGQMRHTSEVVEQYNFRKECFIVGVTLIIGVATVYLAIGGHVWGNLKFPGRLLFMLPVFEMGYFYKQFVEKIDEKLSDIIYLIGIILIQLLIKFTCGGLAFSAVWVTSFANGPIIPYITTLTGTLFWLRISKVVSKIPYVNVGLQKLGDMSFSIMMHHVFGFFLLNSLFNWLYTIKNSGIISGFDVEQYHNVVDYVFLINGNDTWKLNYVLISLAISLLFHLMEKAIKEQWNKKGTL